MAETKQWRCRNDHVLGMISWNGNGIPQLMLYRHAVDLSAERPEEVDVIGSVQGRVPVRCDVVDCNSVRLWEVSVEVMKELLLDLSDVKFEEVLEKVHAEREEEHARKMKKQTLFE